MKKDIPTQKRIDQAIRIACENGYDNAEYLGRWNGYWVFAPIRNESGLFTGFPQYLLLRWGHWRWTKDWKESNKIVDALDS